MPRGNTIVGLDVGSNKVTVLVGEITEDINVRVIGFGHVPSVGIRRGTVVDIENTSRSIEEAIEKAEQMSGRSIEGGYLGFSGASVSSLNNRGVIAVANPDKEISFEDVERVLQAARVVPLPPDREILHVMPRQFIVDGNENILDPEGMIGARLEVETHIITANQAAVRNLLKCCERAGFYVQNIVLNAYASGEAVLFPAEKELGAVIVDIGGGTTDIALFDQGSLWYTCVLPVGGDYITSDLAVGLRTPLQYAEEIKQNYGCTLAALISENEIIEVNSVGGKDIYRVPQKKIAEIIQPRVQEILGLIKNQIERSGYQGLLPGGVVLTGGTALTQGIVELATEVFQKPVRYGYPEIVGGLADVVQSPIFSTGIGLLLYGAKHRSYQAKEAEGLSLKSMLTKIRSWFKDFF